MRVVDGMVKFPFRSAVTPFIGQTHRGVTVIDTEMEMPASTKDQRVYVTDLDVRQLLQTLRWPEPHEYREVKAERDALLAHIQQAEAELAELREFKRAVDVIESSDFRARRKPGRPKETVQ